MSDDKKEKAADAGNIVAAQEVAQNESMPNAPEKQLILPPASKKRYSMVVPDPYPHPVDLADVLTAISNLYKKHIILAPAEADMLALWVAHTYCVEAFSHTPRLLFSSPQKGCGKTTAMSLTGAVSYKALHASSLTPAVVFRIIDKEGPTILADEADTYVYENEDMRNVFNLGHTKSAARVLRCAPNTHEVEEFYAYAPMAIGQIRLPPDTILDRCIVVMMRRKKASEHVEPFDAEHPKIKSYCETIQSKLLRWAGDNQRTIGTMYPQLPPALQNRTADKWRPLFAIAELAGPVWVQKVQVAAGNMVHYTDDDDSGLEIQLLSDIRTVVTKSQASHVSTSDLLAALNDMADRPWPTIYYGKSLDAKRLSDLLRPFGITPKNYTFVGGLRKKGYDVSDFYDSFQRYLS